MSIDYDLLVHRLHKGACAFQSLRAHRRQRAAATDPATAAEVRTPSTTPPPVADLAGDARVAGSREPQAFIAMGSRVVPIFGDVNAVIGATAAPVQGASLIGEPPPPPRPAPAPEEAKPAPPPAPVVSASSTLKLPVPTPPPRLGLVHGGHARPPAREPATTARTEPAAASSTGRNTPPEAAVAPPTPEEAAATIAAMFDTFAQQEVARLEKLHADHRATLATLLQEHREELRARSEADASRTAELLRQVLAEHRTEMDRSARTHAEHLAQISQREAADPDLRAALLEQAKLQRETNEDAADNIGALTTIVADLGQTVGMLAVAAAQEARQGRLPTRPTFAVPPRVEPRADAHAPAPRSEAAPVAPPTAAAPADPASTTTHTAEPSAAHRAVDTPASSPARAPSAEAPQQRPARLTRATEAAARARVLQFADEDRDDDDLETGIDDDDDPPRRRPLAPITDIDPPNLREREHG